MAGVDCSSVDLAWYVVWSQTLTTKRAVVAEGKEHALSVGITQLSTEDM